MMQCQDIDELMVEFLYQELEGERLAAFQAHVDGCARCGAEMKSLMRTRQALRALPEAEPSAAISARLLHEAARRAPKAPDERGGVLAWIGKLFGPIAAHPAWAAAASFVLIAGLAGFLSVRAKLDGQVRQETATASAPAAAEPAPATPPPRDVPVAAGEEREAAKEGLTETKSAKDVRGLTEKAPDPNPGKVAAPATAPSGTKRKAADPALLDEGRDRVGRTASAEEDKKLAAPAKPPRRPTVTRELLGPSTDSDYGAAPAAPPPPAAEPAPAPARGYVAPGDEQAQREALRRDNADDAGDKVKGAVLSTAPSSSLGAGAPAAPAAAPPPPPREEERAAAPAEVQAQAKADAAKPVSKLPPEQEMLQLAQKQATTGRCAEALGTRDRIARMNPEFYRRRVAGDATLRSCEEQSKKNRAAPSRTVKQPAAADESSLEKVTK